jgi:hypothetical protein
MSCWDAITTRPPTLTRWPFSCGVNTTQPGLCSGGRWRDIYTFAITELCARRARTILN